MHFFAGTLAWNLTSHYSCYSEHKKNSGSWFPQSHLQEDMLPHLIRPISTLWWEQNMWSCSVQISCCVWNFLLILSYCFSNLGSRLSSTSNIILSVPVIIHSTSCYLILTSNKDIRSFRKIRIRLIYLLYRERFYIKNPLAILPLYNIHAMALQSVSTNNDSAIIPAHGDITI